MPGAKLQNSSDFGNQLFYAGQIYANLLAGTGPVFKL